MIWCGIIAVPLNGRANQIPGHCVKYNPAIFDLRNLVGRRPALRCGVRTLENTRAREKLGTGHSVPRRHLLRGLPKTRRRWTERSVPNFSPRPLSPAFSFTW